MVFQKARQPLLIVLLQAVVLFAGCGNQATDSSDDEKAKIITRDSRQEEELSTSASSKEQAESEISQGTLQVTAKKKESLKDNSLVEVAWGREVNLDEMMAMAKKGRIVEIQWHIMPNILRAQASDGGIFHLRNENKGVDLRNTLINAGIKVGKGGVLFRHVF